MMLEDVLMSGTDCLSQRINTKKNATPKVAFLAHITAFILQLVPAQHQQLCLQCAQYQPKYERVLC